MARIIGCLATSHVPLIGRAIARGLQQEPYWRDFFAGYRPIHAWLEQVRPDVAVIFYNDHGLNFFLDAMPTFAVGAAEQYQNSDEGWGLPSFGPFQGDPALSWHLIESLMEAQFDLTTCQQMRVDHAFAIPMALAWPGHHPLRVKTVPIAINTVQHPLPTPERCFHLGQAVGRALEAYPQDLRVLVIGSGGLSHQLDGERAGFINQPFDQMCLDRLVSDPLALTHLSVRDLIEQAGSQGVELLMWLAARGTLHGRVSRIHSHYVVPISNTAAATLVLQNAA
ncbi:MAG TPA: class III extradiol dioxygenase family protein [Steroidobacteraceae bacterium]|nr:class III extradiol dioxygenase family protein [Steroidobacteraceae bacterium]